MRLRIFDLATPWFWFVVLYKRGDPILEAKLYRKARANWFHFWQWEPLPQYHPAEFAPADGGGKK